MCCRLLRRCNVIFFFDRENLLFPCCIQLLLEKTLQTNKDGKLKVNKKLSDTRWSARHDAVAAPRKGCKENLIVFEELSTDED